MNERQYKIIDTLIYSVSPVKIDKLQNQTGASERTVKYDIATIRKELKKSNLIIFNKKGAGYYISPDDKPSIIKKYSLSNGSQERGGDNFANILLYFLFENNTVKVSEIAEKLFFSEQSIKNFIKEEKNTLLKPISIQYSNGTKISLIGPEKEMRAFFVNLLFEELKKREKHEIYKDFQDAFPLFKEKIDIDWMSRLEKTFQKLIMKWDIWISEDAYIRLILHLFILHLRRKENIQWLEKEIKFYEGFQSEYSFAKELLEELYWGIIETKEILNLVAVMTDNNIFIDDSLEQSNEKKMNFAVESMVDYVNENYPTFKINRSDFIKDVTPHLRQILRRNRLGIQEKPNPLFYQIKKNYQQYFSVAKKLYKNFCDEFQITYSEDEVSYLTIYLFKNVLQKNQKKHYVYIVCGTGRGFSKLLKTRLTKIFENIEVIDCLSSFRLLKDQEISKADFIISTIELPKMEIPVIKISSFFGQEDINNVQRLLDYGAQVSVLPLPQKNKHPTAEKLLGGEGLSQENAACFSNLFLDLFNLMVELSPEYKINQEKILGITIHLIIALPRYYDSDFVDDDPELVKEVINIERKHPLLAKLIMEFLEIIENIIGKGIPYGERYALYQYIVNEGDLNESRTIQSN